MNKWLAILIQVAGWFSFAYADNKISKKEIADLDGLLTAALQELTGDKNWKIDISYSEGNMPDIIPILHKKEVYNS